MSSSFSTRQGIKNLPEICYQHGLSQVVICPGSRNAPLILSFTAHPSMECLSVTDERSAGYLALGMAQYSNKPTGVLCTSGTAVLNLAPAVSEAYYQNIPLIIFTADRPKEWIDQSDGQTIRQTEIFKNYIKHSFELPLETAHPDDLWFFNRTVSQAIDTATNFPAGPVHINIPLREPLYTPLPLEYQIKNIISAAQVSIKLLKEAENDLVVKWNSFSRKMLVFGMGAKSEQLYTIVRKLSQRNDTVVFAENLSNIVGEDVIYSPEPLIASLSEEEKLQFQPDLLITIGDGIVSKRLKQFLRAFRPREHWHFASSTHYTDTFKILSTIIRSEPVDVLSILAETVSKDSTDFEALKEKNKKLVPLHKEFISKVGKVDLRVMDEILSSVPADSVVHLANSTPVRYAQLSPSRHELTYYSNRGTSGIDGCVSTALGSAYVSGKNTFVVTGDLAFIYDSNALWNDYLKTELKIIVLNNNGGNIFSLIDTSSEMDKAKKFFTTPHRVKIKSLAEAYGVEYLECDEIEKLGELVKQMASIQGTCLLEVKTDATLNTKTFKEYYQFIKSAII
jgi:2-succinyl-5-enolpyruvyl-6-hydroxy-3-cyclohexene-1-carboxylate synthase